MGIRFVTKIMKKSKPRKHINKPLHLILFRFGSSEFRVELQLNSFLESSKRLYKYEFDEALEKLRDHKLYSIALKLSEAMAYKGIAKTVGDQAIHLDLIGKSKGVSAAEEYFAGLPDSSKNRLCYGAMLCCYCKELMAEEAEALVEKMKELKIPLTKVTYNSILALYSNKGQPEKIHAMVQEMKASGVMLDLCSYNLWMRAHAAANDIEGVERVFEELNKDGGVAGDWTTYSSLASIYVEAGLIEKAEIALEKLKSCSRENYSAFQFLIMLYGRTGNVAEVNRAWRYLTKDFRKISNRGYLNMIQALVTLNNLTGAENYFNKWQKRCTSYDIRVANVLIEAYAKNGMLDKALDLKDNAFERGAKPDVRTWEIFFDYYVAYRDFKSAADCFSYATHTPIGNGKKWVLRPKTVVSILRYFEHKKDVVGAEDFLQNLKKVSDKLEAYMFESLIRTYATAGKTSPSLSSRLKIEGVEVSEASKKLLETISVVKISRLSKMNDMLTPLL